MYIYRFIYNIFYVTTNNSLVNRSINDRHQLPEGAIGTSHGKMHIFRTRVRQTKNSEGKRRRSKVKGNEIKGSEL